MRVTGKRSFIGLHHEEDPQMHKLFKRFVKDESGVTAIEYGLIAALVAVFLITALSFLAGELESTFNTVGSELQNASGGGATPPAST
jgi:pilus assembly protein Flp/PilA